MQHKKIIVSLGVFICLCASSSFTTYADTAVSFVDEDISLAYEIACNPISELEITGNTAYCTSNVGGTDAVSITITQTLQKHWGLWIWNDVEGAEWTRTVNRNSIRLSSTKQNLEKGTYRVKSVFTLTNKNGKTETITIYSDEKTVG